MSLDPEYVKKDAKKLLLDMYVGGSLEEVNRMQGVKGENGQYNGTLSTLLKSVGLSLKTMVQSGSEDTSENDKLSGKVLGYGWDPSTDFMSVKFRFNISKRMKGKRLSPDLNINYLYKRQSRSSFSSSEERSSSIRNVSLRILIRHISDSSAGK